MYARILVALENGRADDALLPHVQELASRLGSSLLLVHVADGFAARHFAALKLDLRLAGLIVDVHLAMGEPATEILRVAADHACDLIAMGTHGHRFIADLVHGSTISEVRHKAAVPVLLVQGNPRQRS
jgi:manganese transport protein